MPGSRDPDAEDRGGVDSAVGQYRFKPGQDRLNDQPDFMLPGIKRIVGPGLPGHCQVEQLNADSDLTDIDPYDVPVIRADLEQGARTAAI